MRNKNSIVWLALSAVLVACCSKGSEAPSTTEVPTATQPAVVVHETAPQETSILVSKGVIRSENEVPVFSRLTGQLGEVTLIDGQHVKKGEVLFSLDDSELRADVELCQEELEQARMLMEETLIGLGYKRGQLTNVPEDVARLARIKSGVNVREKQLQIASAKLANTRIKAPISGVVAKMTPSSYAYVNPGENLCQVIDTERLIVEFSVLETELRRFQIGSQIKVFSVAYSEQEHTAVVRSIGSIVDDAGMIRIEASLCDADNLMPGMTAIVKL